ncbi:hypothetical protein [Lignipirellula cremea]|uniref:Uncharacterized protein n=1 Tax=Lignipirellula cremea TaxID=2528010 RepID=A0A518E3C4_9BACT|nr:hypothetical protein [Lignipirellula cremea]QDU98595.1 hypothetical protein Pla8534_64660 [Lignipirellula cremea]
MTQNPNKPADTLYDRTMKAVIWTNQSSEGPVRYNVEFVRSYKTDNGEWKESRSFSGAELLRVGRLASLAYDRIAELRRQEKQEEGGQ